MISAGALQTAVTSPGKSAIKAAAESYPRVFSGRKLSTVAFPLGGVGAGSVSLGGRGQLCDWEIFNKPDKGRLPEYGFAAISVERGGHRISRVLESEYLPPFEGQLGLGWKNAPGLPRLAAARFTGTYPLARVNFEDPDLGVEVSLDAFSPFIPHNEDDSGLPVAILRYLVRNPRPAAATMSIAFSLENPVLPEPDRTVPYPTEQRVITFRKGSALSALYMDNPTLPASNMMKGSVALGVLNAGNGDISYLQGWSRSRWLNPALLFWDDFTADGQLGPDPETPYPVGSLCLRRSIAARQSADFTFLLAWHFPNRTPRRCGWTAPKGDENVVIGNWYTNRFPDAWAAAEYAASNLVRLEAQTRTFAEALHASSLPACVKDAASANLSTLASTTCFRTADGEFHGFEGSNDKLGAYPGNCTHVWNYETATAFLFPAFAKSLRRSAFGYSLDEAGAMHFRQLLPDGKERSGFAAADGQMGQIVHAYLDWKLSGDRQMLEHLWPRVQKAMAFCWIPGGWDADRDGVMEGAQHNTYDVEFYGPTPLCSVQYLAALRACEEMALAMHDQASARQYRDLFEKGSRWMDANLFNGEYYVQTVKGIPAAEVAPSLRSRMGSRDTENPTFQIGTGCMTDQLVGEYFGGICGLGSLLNPAHIRTALESIYRCNFKRDLSKYESVLRTFAVGHEGGVLNCSYTAENRPKLPFPYFGEVWTGVEYAAAALMFSQGMIREGTEIVSAARDRYDGERRNPWDEVEAGHHYARAMASWSLVQAISGFQYDAPTLTLKIVPRIAANPFRCFWSTARGWGTFERSEAALRIKVQSGEMKIASCLWPAVTGKGRVALNRQPLPTRVRPENSLVRFDLDPSAEAHAGDEIKFEM